MNYPQIDGSPAVLTKEQARVYDRPVQVGFKGQVRMCILSDDIYYEYMYMSHNKIGREFCTFEEAEAYRGCTSFDF